MHFFRTVVSCPNYLCVGEIIFDVCRQHLPHAKFSAIDSPSGIVRDLNDNETWLIALASHDFLVLRDNAAAERNHNEHALTAGAFRFEVEKEKYQVTITCYDAQDMKLTSEFVAAIRNEFSSLLFRPPADACVLS